MEPAVGGTVLAEVMGVRLGSLPAVDYQEYRRMCTLVREGIQRGIIASARDVSDGGYWSRRQRWRSRPLVAWGSRSTRTAL